MTTENLSTLKINKLTQAQYERELEAGNIKDNELYLTLDEGFGGLPEFSTANNDEFLRIINGVPTWSAVPNAEDHSF